MRVTSATTCTSRHGSGRRRTEARSCSRRRRERSSMVLLGHRPRGAPLEGHRGSGLDLPTRREELPAAQDDLQHEPSAARELVRRPRARARTTLCASFSDGARLLTLTGPGGSGKTRLALEAATDARPVIQGGRLLGRARRAARALARDGDDRADAGSEGRARRAHRRAGDAPAPRQPGAGDRGCA